MAAKKATAKSAAGAPPAKGDPDAFEVDLRKATESQALAKLATTSILAAKTVKAYTHSGAEMEMRDLVVEMRKAGDEAVAGDLGRVERMLAHQAITLDGIFNALAQMASREATFKNIEVLLRVGLKAQAQARSTAEALAEIKNPRPVQFVKQANMTTGPQQVNNTYAGEPLHTDIQSGAGNFESVPNKLLEADHGSQRLDTGAQAAAGSTHKALEAVGAVHRACDT